MTQLHIVSILDRSGSMGGSEKEVIGAYNAFVEQQKKIVAEKGIKARMTLVLFDNQYDVIYEKAQPDLVPKLDEKTYFVRGMTALFDAVGKTIGKFEGEKKVIFFIETDGHENASREFNATTLKALVEKKKAEGWDFNFVGADLDAATASSMATSFLDAGSAAKTQVFAKSAAGYATRNAAFASATMMYVDPDAKVADAT